MKEIIAPLPREEIIAELTPDKFLRKTNKGSNEIYVITYHDSPAIMHEIGRLREITFRDAGGGTGSHCWGGRDGCGLQRRSPSDAVP